MDYVTFPFEKFVSCITTEYDVQADSILALYIEIAKYLRDNPIISVLTVKEIIDKYFEENMPAVSVVSVNGKTGVVTGLYDAENPPPYPVTSVNGQTGAVNGLYDVENPPPYPVTSVNGQTGDVVIQGGGIPDNIVTSVNGRSGAVVGVYDTKNPPPYPVTSVNGQTGAVNGLYGVKNPPPYPVTSVNGQTGAVNGLYGAKNPPPYPVTSVNRAVGAVNGIEQKGMLAVGTKINPGTQSWYINNPSPGATVPEGNTGGFNVIFSGDINGLIPICASFATDNGYSAQISVSRLRNGLRVVITNHGVEGGIALGPVFVFFTALADFTVTEVG